MPFDFATQIGVTRLPHLTGDGRDGFPSRAQHDWCVAQYLGEMCEKKRGKALIDKNLYDRILAVCIDDTNKKTETAQFRWWVRRTFKLYSEPYGHYLMHENRPIAVKEQIYDILVYAHAECGHGGRDKTSAAVRRYFSWIPKDVVSRFVSVCPGCHARTQKDDEYFSNKGIDGYYPVHDQVRQMSIDSRRCSVDDYKHTSPYQPLLAAGMVKILKAVEGARSFIPLPDNTSRILEVPSAPHQPNYLPISGSRTQSAHLASGSAPAYANNQPRSLSLPAVGFNDNSSAGQGSQRPAPSANPVKATGRVTSARSKSQCSPFPHIAKRPRPSSGRKLSSKSKEYKKMVIAESFAPSADRYCSNAYYGSQSSTQSVSNSEDDGTSKSTFSSPPSYQSSLKHQEIFQDYSLTQSSSLNPENLQYLDLHAEVGPLGEYSLGNPTPDFPAFGGLPSAQLGYMNQYLGDALLGGVQGLDCWNAGNGAACDYILPGLLNSQLFDNSPNEHCPLVSLPTPGGLTDQYGHDALVQSTFPALDSWSSGAATHDLYNVPDPCYQALYLPISQANAGLFPLGNHTAASEIDTHHQQGLVFSNIDSLKNFANIQPSSSFPSNSLGIDFSSNELQFSPNPIY